MFFILDLLYKFWFRGVRYLNKYIWFFIWCIWYFICGLEYSVIDLSLCYFNIFLVWLLDDGVCLDICILLFIYIGDWMWFLGFFLCFDRYRLKC